MPRDGADHHDLRGVCQGNRCGRESAEYIDDLRTPRAFSRPLARRAWSRAPSPALGSQRTLRWTEPDSNRWSLAERPVFGRASKKSVAQQLDAKDEAWPTGRQRSQAMLPFTRARNLTSPQRPTVG